MTSEATRRQIDGWVPAGLLLLTLVPVIAGVVRLVELASHPVVTAQNQRFVEAPLPVVFHIVASLTFSVLGAFQFSSGIRRRWPGWHRTSGRLLIPLGFVSALSALWMTQFHPAAPNDGHALYVLRLGFGSAMLLCLVIATGAVIRRDFTSHGAWMTRGYAIGLGAGTQVLTHLPWFILVGEPDETVRAVLMGAGWFINVIVAEMVIRWNRRH